MQTIKAGIIGTGFSAGFHIESLRRIPYVEIVAVSGSSGEKAKAMAERYGIPRFYGSYSDLIADPDIQVVHNCTPNSLHFEINKAVLRAGLDLLSEKPLAMDSRESAQLAELAAKSRSVSGVCFNYRHFPMVMQARSMIQSRQYGKPHLVMGSYLQDWLLYATDYSWRLDPEKNGASRAVADIGSHLFDTVQFVLGQKIVSVFADLTTVHPVRKKPKAQVATFGQTEGGEFEELEVSTEDCGAVVVRFEDNTTGTFTVSQVSAGRKNKLQFEIATSELTLYWDQENPNKLWKGRRNQSNGELMRDPALLLPDAAALAHFPGGHEEGWPDGMKNLLIDFYREVKRTRGLSNEKGSSAFASIGDGHYMMRLVEAVLESSREKKWVTI